MRKMSHMKNSPQLVDNQILLIITSANNDQRSQRVRKKPIWMRVRKETRIDQSIIHVLVLLYILIL